MRKRQQLESSVQTYRKLEGELDDCITLIELGEAEKDDATIAEGENALKKLDADAQRRGVEALLSGEADGNDCFLEIHAGAGGTESQDWASMLLRLYSRWAESRGYKVSIVEYSAGEEAGIKSALGDQRRERFRLAEDGERRAPPCPHLALQLERSPTHQLLVRLGVSGRR